MKVRAIFVALVTWSLLLVGCGPHLADKATNADPKLDLFEVNFNQSRLKLNVWPDWSDAWVEGSCVDSQRWDIVATYDTYLAADMTNGDRYYRLSDGRGGKLRPGVTYHYLITVRHPDGRQKVFACWSRDGQYGRE